MAEQRKHKPMLDGLSELSNDEKRRVALAEELGLALWRWEATGHEVVIRTRSILTVLLTVAKAKSRDGGTLAVIALLEAVRMMIGAEYITEKWLHEKVKEIDQ